MSLKFDITILQKMKTKKLIRQQKKYFLSQTICIKTNLTNVCDKICTLSENRTRNLSWKVTRLDRLSNSA